MPTTTYRIRNARVTFRAAGRQRAHGRRRNKVNWSTRQSMSAVLTVGLRDQDTRMKPGQSRLREVMDVVRRVREAQGYAANSTFLTQEGWYKYTKGRVETLDEPGVQIIIYNEDPDNVKYTRFRDEMKALGVALARYFNQESVILDLRKKNITEQVFGLGFDD